jgi:hypothetical protein
MAAIVRQALKARNVSGAHRACARLRAAVFIVTIPADNNSAPLAHALARYHALKQAAGELAAEARNAPAKASAAAEEVRTKATADIDAVRRNFLKATGYVCGAAASSVFSEFFNESAAY